MDNPRSVQPISGSIPSKQVSNVFLAQVTISTKSNPLVHVLELLGSGANSCFRDTNFAQAHHISLRKLPCPASVVEESGPISVALKNLAFVVSFNIISRADTPIFFVKKEGGLVRLVVGYHGLNKVTIRNKYALPLISSLLERINGAEFFTKINL